MYIKPNRCTYLQCNYICIYLHLIHIYLYNGRYIYIYMFTYMHIFSYLYIYIHACGHVYLDRFREWHSKDTSIFTCTNMYVYIYMRINFHLYFIDLFTFICHLHLRRAWDVRRRLTRHIKFREFMRSATASIQRVFHSWFVHPVLHVGFETVSRCHFQHPMSQVLAKLRHRPPHSPRGDPTHNLP